MAGEQTSESLHKVKRNTRSGFTAINRTEISEDVQPVQSRSPRNLQQSDGSHESKPKAVEGPRNEAQKPYILQPRHDDGSRVSKPTCRAPKVFKAPRRSGKENIPPFATTAKDSHSADITDDDLLTPPPRETNAKLKKSAAPARRAGPPVQQAAHQREDAIAKRERAITGARAGAAAQQAVPTKRNRGQGSTKFLREHVAEAGRRSDLKAKAREEEARAREEQQQRMASQSRARNHRGNADHVQREKGEPDEPWMRASSRNNKYIKE